MPAMRAVLSAAFLFPVIAALHRPLRLQAPLFTAIIGILQTTGFVGLITWALEQGAAGRTSVLVYTMPFWLLLMAWMFLGERVRGLQWPAVIIALVGLVLVLRPWQLEGTVRTLLEDGYRDLIAAHNRTVVVDAYVGERNNKHKLVTDKYGLRNVHLYEPEVEWVRYEPKAPMLVLDDVYPDGIYVPGIFFDKNIVQMPTVKTHVFTTITGAMKNAFGGLLSERRHWTHAVIHETVVDLLAIQQEIHSGLFAVMDGTFAGDGPGPRAMWVDQKDLILASADQVAIDAVAARLMGMDPLSIKFIRLAHDMGLGCGDPREIEIVGDLDAAAENWRFTGPFQKMTFASRMQHKIYWGPLKKPIEWSLKTVLAPWSYLASVAYHDTLWYPLVGAPRVKAALRSDWGKLFRNWETVRPDPQGRGYPDVGREGLELQRSGSSVFWRSFGVLGMAVKEAPEFAANRRRAADRAR